MFRLARRRIGAALDRRFGGVNVRVETVGARVDGLVSGVQRLEQSLAATAAELAAMRETNAAALRWLVQDHVVLPA